MGFKIRAGMAVGGFVLSYFFGLGFLSGIASHLDTTGNILVDIADGIGLVSKVQSITVALNRGAAEHKGAVRYCQGCRQLSLFINL